MSQVKLLGYADESPGPGIILQNDTLEHEFLRLTLPANTFGNSPNRNRQILSQWRFYGVASGVPNFISRIRLGPSGSPIAALTNMAQATPFLIQTGQFVNVRVRFYSTEEQPGDATTRVWAQVESEERPNFVGTGFGRAQSFPVGNQIFFSTFGSLFDVTAALDMVVTGQWTVAPGAAPLGMTAYAFKLELMEP